jgi:hypothetical protein
MAINHRNMRIQEIIAIQQWFSGRAQRQVFGVCALRNCSLDAALTGTSVAMADCVNSVIYEQIDMLKVDVHSIHLRVEHEIQGRLVAFGFIFPGLTVRSADASGSKVKSMPPNLPFVWKKLSIEPCSINFDRDAAPADLESFQD